MLFENSRDNLIQTIKSKILQSSNASFVNRVKKILVSEDKFDIKDFLKFITHNELIDMLPNQELFWFADAIEQTNNKICKTSDFFTEHEIKQNKTYFRNSIDISDLLVLKHAYPLDKNQWACTVSVEQLALLRNHNIIRTDSNFQRQSKVIKNRTSDDILRRIHVNWKRVNEISSDIVSGKYNYNTVRLNLMDDGEFKPIYDEDEHIIIIPEGSDVIIPDGNHRTLAACQAYSQNPEMKDYFSNKYFQVAFTFFDVKRVKDCISQEWKVERVIEKHKKAMQNSYANDIVDYVKNSKNGAESIYSSKIVSTGEECKIGNGFIIYSDFSDAIEKYYNVSEFKLQSQANQVGSWLIEFFNELSILMVDDFANYKSVKKQKWSVNSYSWIGYTYLSKILKDDPMWRDKLRKIINSIDWNKDNSPIKSTSGITNQRMIEEYFKRKVSDLDV